MTKRLSLIAGLIFLFVSLRAQDTTTRKLSLAIKPEIGSFTLLNKDLSIFPFSSVLFGIGGIAEKHKKGKIQRITGKAVQGTLQSQGMNGFYYQSNPANQLLFMYFSTISYQYLYNISNYRKCLFFYVGLSANVTWIRQFYDYQVYSDYTVQYDQLMAHASLMAEARYQVCRTGYLVANASTPIFAYAWKETNTYQKTEKSGQVLNYYQYNGVQFSVQYAHKIYPKWQVMAGSDFVYISNSSLTYSFTCFSLAARYFL